MTERDDFRAKTIARVIEADTALHHGDPEPRSAMWSHHNPVTVFGAMQSKSGWADLEPFFRWLATQFSQVSGYTYDLVACDASGDLAYTVGYERYTGSIGGSPVQETVLRVTQIFRREQGEWKVVHRHGDFAAAGEELVGQAERC
jgi:ketosteroid isomerase-like protein